MKTLVVIPSLMHKFSFSAPLAWLFAKDTDKVHGVYSAFLTRELVVSHHQFIVELNWFIELYEFGLIVDFIKRHNRNAKILFGGLYSQLKYKEIFQRYAVDYFIKGDAEVPIRQFLAGIAPRQIHNLIARDFENPHSYRFTASEFADLEFDTDWLQGFDEGWESYPGPDSDEDMCFDELPRYPKYWEDERSKSLPLSLRWRVSPKGGRYHLPMLLTARGGCPAAHQGCEYCMGSKSDAMRTIYDRPPVVMSNEDLKQLLTKIDRKFKRVSVYINSDFVYDLRGQSFDLEATIEIDSPSSAAQAAMVLPAFRKARLHVALFDEGLTGTTRRTSPSDYLDLVDENHRVYFFASPGELANHNIPEELRLYSEFIFPFWTHWDYYNNLEKALRKSRQWYLVTGQTNLYPNPERTIKRLIRGAAIPTMWALHKTGLVDIKRFLL